MYKLKMRSVTGCLTCRRRRKKCDETKPNCGSCLRLRLQCFYQTSERSENQPRRRQSTNMRTAPHTSLTPPAKIPELTHRARVADFRSPDHVPSVLHDDILPLIIGYQRQNHKSILSQPELLEAFIILGIQHGWQEAYGRYGPCSEIYDSYWARIPHIDARLKLAGHGQAARMAFVWYFVVLSQYLCSLDGGEHIVKMPSWFVPRSPHRSSDETMITDYIPWPKVRQRMASNAHRYCGKRFMADLSDASRFIWPFQVTSAIMTDFVDGRQRFSDEFTMRITNIRCLTLSKDFLDKYPEFRGEAPQLEPSLSLTNPQTCDVLEELYWNTRRASRTRKLSSSEQQIQMDGDYDTR